MCFVLAFLLIMQESGSDTSQTWLERQVAEDDKDVAADYNVLLKIVLVCGIWIQIMYGFISPSLFITMDWMKKIHNYFMEWDILMYDEELDRPMRAQVSNMNDNLGQVEFLLSDKTGTLTQNVMVTRHIMAGGSTYSFGGSNDYDKMKLSGVLEDSFH